MPSPSLERIGDQKERFKQKRQMLLDGKLVKFADFDILEQLGEGSFGRVYKGRRLGCGQVVALKFLPKHGRADRREVSSLTNFTHVGRQMRQKHRSSIDASRLCGSAHLRFLGGARPSSSHKRTTPGPEIAQ